MLMLTCGPLGAPLPVSSFTAKTGMIAMHTRTKASANTRLFLIAFSSFGLLLRLIQNIES
jgi:hypothetical protein